MVTREEIEEFYTTNKSYIVNHIKLAGGNGNALDIYHDIIITILESADKIDDLNNYAWGIIRNKLKMLYRSADHKAEKPQFLDGHHEHTNPFVIHGQTDAEALHELSGKDKICLMLSKQGDEYRITNGIGTLDIVADSVSVGKHNSGHRYSSRFTFRGNKYYGISYGDLLKTHHVRKNKPPID